MIIKKTAKYSTGIVTTKWYFLGIKIAEFQKFMGR